MHDGFCIHSCVTGALNSVGEGLPVLGQTHSAGLLRGDCYLHQYLPSPPLLVGINTPVCVQSSFMLLSISRDFRGLGGLLKCAAAEILRTTEV